jgi:hypothetical protein
MAISYLPDPAKPLVMTYIGQLVAYRKLVEIGGNGHVASPLMSNPKTYRLLTMSVRGMPLTSEHCIKP